MTPAARDRWSVGPAVIFTAAMIGLPVIFLFLLGFLKIDR